MEHDDFDDMIESLTDEESIEEMVESAESEDIPSDSADSIKVKEEVKELCQSIPASELSSVPLVDLATTTETNLKQRIEQAIESGHVDAAVADSEKTQSSKAESEQSGPSIAAPGVVGSGEQGSGEAGQKKGEIGKFNPFYYDSVDATEYYEKLDVRSNPIVGYYMPPPDLIKWDLVEEERAIFTSEQANYIADVAKHGHLAAAQAAITRVHALERGIKLAGHAVFSLRDFVKESLHNLTAAQKLEYDKLDVAEREKYLKKAAKKSKMPGLINKGGVAAGSGSESKSAQAKAAAADRAQMKKIIEGYHTMAVAEEQDMEEAAKEVTKKLENKGLLTDIAKMMVKKLFV
jgi:hypothetical protein